MGRASSFVLLLSVLALSFGCSDAESESGPTAAEADLVDEPPDGIAPLQRAVFIKSHGDAFQTNIAAYQTWFEHAGYEPARIRGTIEEWKDPATFRGASVVEVETHGGASKLASQVTDGYSLMTGTCVRNDRRTPRAYRDDMISGHLGFAFAINTRSLATIAPHCMARIQNKGLFRGAPMELSYAIQPSFVRKYVHFEPKTMLVLNSCKGNTPRSAEFRSAVHDAGIGLLLGWNDAPAQPGYNSATSYLFDRMLGANEFHPESPPQRPFGQHAVRIWMSERKLNQAHFEWGEKKIDATLLPDRTEDWSDPNKESGFAAFVPSLTEVTAFDTSLTLWGDFGDDPKSEGVVTLAGNVLPIKSWKKSYIEVELPAPLAIPGPVVVNVRKHPSNAVPLTAWRGMMHLVRTDVWSGSTTGRVVAKLDLDLHLLGDLHRYRSRPGEEPKPNTMLFRPRRDSKVRFDINGELTRTRIDGTIDKETISARPMAHDMDQWWTESSTDGLALGTPTLRFLTFKSWRAVSQGRTGGSYDSDITFAAKDVKLTVSPAYIITADPHTTTTSSTIEGTTITRTVEITLEPLQPQGPPGADTAS